MSPPPDHRPPTDAHLAERARRALGVFRFTGRAMELVWRTSRPLLGVLMVLTVIAGLLPGAIAWVGRQIVDGVLAAAASGLAADRAAALWWVAAELGLVATVAAAQRGLELCQSLLRAQLGHRVNVMILDKALELALPQFEDSEFYDKMTRARREASTRPLSLVRRALGLVQNTLSLITYGAILLTFSPWAVLLLALAAIPAFVAEARFAGEAFRLFRWRSPDTRQQMYLETIIAREDFAKEVKLLALGPTLLDRYRAIFARVYGDDRNLAIRRSVWGFGLGLLGTLALYGAYGWIVATTVAAVITLGQMTMYLMVFKQGQSAFTAMLSSVGGMYEDNLYLSNLYEYLEQPSPVRTGDTTVGAVPGDGIRFEDVGFTYPGASQPAVSGVTLHIQPGRKLALVGPNGSGKTTLIKLLTRLYEPDQGRILVDGTDVRDWDLGVLRRRFGVIFQDFVRYQLRLGENIGVGDVPHMDDPERQARAAEKGMADSFIEEMPDGYQTQLGRWFKDGRELSGGQWQKIALSRAFMREDADVLVLDEPTSAMDAEAEALIFARVQALSPDQVALLISHRFSTVRMADEIVVLDQGRIVEHGDHHALMALDGRYAHLFTLQAAGYQ